MCADPKFRREARIIERQLDKRQDPRMPLIVDLRAYDGFERRTERLGLSPTVDEIKELITGFDLRVAETTVSPLATAGCFATRPRAALYRWLP